MLRVRCRNSPAPGPVLFAQKFYDGISPPPRYLPLVLHQLDHPVELSEHGRVVVQSEFEEFDLEFIWSSHCLHVSHRPQGCDYLVFCWFDPESVCNLPDFASRRAPKNRAHLPRISLGSSSILPSSSRIYYDLTAFAWASPIHPRPGSLRPRGGATSSAVCSMTVATAVSASSTMPPLGVTALRCSPTTVFTYYFLI